MNWETSIEYGDPKTLKSVDEPLQLQNVATDRFSLHHLAGEKTTHCLVSLLTGLLLEHFPERVRHLKGTHLIACLLKFSRHASHIEARDLHGIIRMLLTISSHFSGSIRCQPALRKGLVQDILFLLAILKLRTQST